MGVIDLGVFLAAGAAPLLLMYVVSFLRGRSLTLYTPVFVLSAAFGAGVAIISRAKGWV